MEGLKVEISLILDRKWLMGNDMDTSFSIHNKGIDDLQLISDDMITREIMGNKLIPTISHIYC